MLLKHTDSRPDLRLVEKLLGSIQSSSDQNPPGQGLAALACAGAKEAERQARKETEKQQILAKQKNRVKLAQDGIIVLGGIFYDLSEKIKNYAPTANVDNILLESRSRIISGRITLGTGRIEWRTMDPEEPVSEDGFSKSNWDVVTGAKIRVRQETNKRPGYGSSLWYMRKDKADSYRWFEVSYKLHPLSRKAAPYEPFELDSIQDADLAAASGMQIYEIASEPEPIDYGDSQTFLDRWFKRFAEASQGRLQRPR